MRTSRRLVIFTLVLICTLAAAGTSDARWQGPLVAVGIGPNGPPWPYSYPPYSPVYYPSPPIVQVPPVPQQRPKVSVRAPAGAITIQR